MSDILGTYFFFGSAEYLWGIAVDPVFALLVWIVPRLRKRARAGRECRLAGMDSPYTGMWKSYLSGMTHLPKGRHIRGVTPPGRGQLQPPLPSPCLRSQAGCSTIWRVGWCHFMTLIPGRFAGEKVGLDPGSGPARPGPRDPARCTARRRCFPGPSTGHGRAAGRSGPAPVRSGPSPAGPAHPRPGVAQLRPDRPIPGQEGPIPCHDRVRTSPSPGRLDRPPCPPGAGSPAPELWGAGVLPGLRRAEGGGARRARRGHGGDELARGRAQEDPQPAGAGGRRRGAGGTAAAGGGPGAGAAGGG